VESKLEKNVFFSLMAKENLIGIIMISKPRRYAILLTVEIFIGTAPHVADGLGWLVQEASRITVDDHIAEHAVGQAILEQLLRARWRVERPPARYGPSDKLTGMG
jgi:hypothetical protein